MQNFTQQLQHVWKIQTKEEFFEWLSSKLELSIKKHLSSQIKVPSPKAFFVAWQGVITLAFQGFDDSIWKLKEELSQVPNIKKENSGSLWPKTTIAALENDKTLSIEELAKLKEICNKANKELLPLWKSEEMDRLSIIIYLKRSLEQPYISRYDINLPMQSSIHSEINKESASLVEKVIHEWDDLEAYHSKVSQKGNRKDHYHQDIQIPECTLIYFLHSEENKKLIQKFQDMVEEILPGYYFWMPTNCIHMTIRAIQKI